MGDRAPWPGIALASFFLSAAAPSPPPAYSLETISHVPTARLAERLLGPEAAADVESHDVVDGGQVEFLIGVRFLHRPRPLAADICGRPVHYVSFSLTGMMAPDSAPRQRVAEPGPVIEVMQIALAPGCRLAPGQAFADFGQSLSREAAADALRAVAALSSAARGPDAVAFSLTCRDELGQGVCGIDGREALAAVPIEQAWLIQPDPDTRGWIRVLVGAPGQLYWELRFPGGASVPAELVMTRKVPAPF